MMKKLCGLGVLLSCMACGSTTPTLITIVHEEPIPPGPPPAEVPRLSESGIPLPEHAVSIHHGVEDNVDDCIMSTFYIMDVEGTATARATWHCDGQPPQDARELVKGDCVMLSTQRWCVHDVVLVSEASNEPGSSEDSLVLVPESK